MIHVRDLRALLEMFVNSDSLFRQYEAQVEDFLNREAKDRGYKNWEEAYIDLKQQEPR